MASPLVGDEAKVEAAWAALGQGAVLSMEAGKAALKAALKQQPQGSSSKAADGVVAAVAAGEHQAAACR